MKIVSISLVRNESDIIELFVRHTSNFVDHLYIVDNFCTDNSREILTSLIEEGYPITVFTSKVKEQRLGETVMSIIKRIDTSDVDYIIPVDPDEFIDAPSRQDLENDLLRIPKMQYGTFYWKTYIPSSLETDNCLEQMQYRCDDEPFILGKIAFGKELFDGILLYPGTHNKDVRYEKGDVSLNITGINLKTNFCHFPVRSKNQVILKFITMYCALKNRNDNKTGNIGFQNKIIVDKLLECKYNPSLETLQSFVYDYGYDPENMSKEGIFEPFKIFPNTVKKYKTDSDLVYNIAYVIGTLV